MQVLVEPFKGGFRARTGEPWDIAVEGDTEPEVLEGVRRIVRERLREGARLVELQTPDVSAENPWRKVAGIFAADPTFDAWQEEIRQYRRDRDAEADPETP